MYIPSAQFNNTPGKMMMKNMFVTCLISFVFLQFFSEAAGALKEGDSVEPDITKFLKEGEPLALVCILNITGPVTLEWSKDGNHLQMDDDHYEFLIKNHTMIIKSSAKDDIGNYRCQVVGRPKENYDFSVIALSYKKMPKSLTVLQGQELRLECEAYGTPVPNITWEKNSTSINKVYNESHYTLEENEKEVPGGTLVINEANEDDRGQFTCFISSEGAHFNTTIFIRVKSMYAALWPFLGICAEVIILCLIIFVYEKRQMKNDFEESDTDQPADHHKNTSDYNKDLRQRK